ncbi:MAG: hypothetical protein M1831_003161 [Alyxoria varia]|nr:MAG: hypothetical protein M1831_003161 [Alyxoria varia]
MAEPEQESSHLDPLHLYGSDSRSASRRSGSVESDSSALQAEENLQQQSTKRREPRSGDVEERAPKRRRSSFSAGNNLYLELLNDSIEHAASGSCYEKHDPLEDSQVGLTYWKAEEKEALLRILERCGEQGMPRVCHALPSKSELEISQYMQLVRRGAMEHMLTAKRKKRFDYMEIPAAMEISSNCCKALATKAERLRARELCHEVCDEQMHFGEHWLLDQSAADRVEGILNSDPSFLSNEEESSAAALPPSRLPMSLAKPLGLFNLPTWLELSERVFMNPRDPKKNESWCNMEAEQLSETPALFASAISDFYDLAESFMRRLVSTVLFHATSRLRAANSRVDRKPAQVIRQCDVITALDVLGVQRDSWNWWSGVPRRCKLSVYDVKEGQLPVQHSNRQYRASPMETEDVERAMQLTPAESRAASKTRRASDEMDGSKDNLEEAVRPIGTANEKPTEVEIDAGQPDETPYGHLEHRLSDEPRRNHLDALFRAQESMADAIDSKASQKEEARLWRIIGVSSLQNGKSRQDHMAEDDDLDGLNPEDVLTPQFALYKRTAADIHRSDWRYQTTDEHQGLEWERYGRFLDHSFSSFDNNDQKF